MRDPRIDKLAEMLVTYSMGVQKGDHVAMNLLNPVPAFAEAAIEQVYKAGALPFVQITNSEVSRAVNRGMDEAMAKRVPVPTHGSDGLRAVLLCGP